MRGTGITLTTDIEALGTRHRAGDQGKGRRSTPNGHSMCVWTTVVLLFPPGTKVHTRGELKGLGPAVPTVSTPRVQFTAPSHYTYWTSNHVSGL